MVATRYGAVGGIHGTTNHAKDEKRHLVRTMAVVALVAMSNTFILHGTATKNWIAPRSVSSLHESVPNGLADHDASAHHASALHASACGVLIT